MQHKRDFFMKRLISLRFFTSSYRNQIGRIGGRQGEGFRNVEWQQDHCWIDVLILYW